MESVVVVYGIILLVIAVIYVGTTVYIIVDSRKYNDINVALWVVLNLVIVPIGFIGYLIERHRKN